MEITMAKAIADSIEALALEFVQAVNVSGDTKEHGVLLRIAEALENIDGKLGAIVAGQGPHKQ